MSQRHTYHEPINDSMTPEGSDDIRASSPKGTAREANLGQDRADVDFWCGSGRRSTTNFGQVGDLQVLMSEASHTGD